MFLGIMEHKKKLQLVHFKSYPNHAPSHKYYLLLYEAFAYNVLSVLYYYAAEGKTP